MVCGIILRKHLFSRIWKHGKSDVNLDAGYMDDRNSSLKQENFDLELY